MLMLSSRMLPSLNSVHSSGFIQTAFSLSSGLVLLPVVLTTGSSIMAISFGIAVVVAMVTHLPRLCPKSFTFGELCVVCHLAGDFVWRSMRWLTEFISNQGRPPISEEACLYVLISVICIFVAFATITILLVKPVKNILFFILLYCIFTLMGFGTYCLITNLNPAVWLLQFVFTRQERLLLLGWWVLLTVVTAMGVCLYPTLAKKTGTVDKASTAMRKCFHLVVVAVYVPGLVHDPAFLLLASVVALAVLALLETARVTRVKWLGTTIDIAFHVFTDSRDQGPVLLTHIYLLVGLSVPLWLSCNINNKAMLLQLSSGILSLGIGDTIACIAGMRYGLTKWPGTCKSLQGTGFSVTAQLIFITTGLFLGWFESFSWSGVVFAVVASSVYEALTSQIDNLVLPLYTLAALPV
ncbi:dolichol kinase-like isoform X2 [Pomacea canaliculata]|nr:dolichol kinase-like isoform X2 [Pomacea canaliculata]